MKHFLYIFIFKKCIGLQKSYQLRGKVMIPKRLVSDTKGSILDCKGADRRAFGWIKKEKKELN